MPLRWNGKGFVRGVPAQDLTDEQVKQYGEKRLLKSGCYEKVNNKNYKRAEEKPANEDGE